MSRRSTGAGIAAAAGLIAVLTLFSRVAGFGRTLVFADAVRAAGVGDVYNSVNAVPNVLYEVAAGGVLAAVAVPVVAGHLGRGDTGRAHRSASALLSWTLTVLVPLAVLLWLFAAPITRALLDVPGAPGAAGTGAVMLRIFAVQVPLYGIGIVLAGVLQAHRHFFAVALAPLLSSLVVIATYLAYGAAAQGATTTEAVAPSAVRLLAWGTTAGVAVLSLPLAVPAWRVGFRWRPTWRFVPGDGRRSVGLAGAGLIALLAQQLAVLATIWVARHRGGGGSFSVYGYIQAVYLLPYAVLAVPVATAAFPALAGGAAPVAAPASALAHPPAPAGPPRVPSGPDVLRQSLRAVLVLSGVGAAVLLSVAGPVQDFFVALDVRRGGGEVSGPALLALGGGLAAYAPGLLGFGVSALLLRALYVHGRPLLGALVLATGWLVAAGLPLAMLENGAGPDRTLRTLGLASSLGMTVSGLGLAWLVRRAWGAPALAGTGRTAGAVVVALAGGVAVGDALAAALVGGSGLLSAALAGLLAGVAAAGAFVAVLAVADRDTVRGAFRRGRARRRGTS